jgi:UDP-N-acetylmuramate--alanine ligase
VTVFQPHLFSRTQTFATQFGDALMGSDVVVVLPIYPSREKPIPGVTHDLVVEATRRSGHGHAHPATSFEEALTVLEALLRPGDVLLTLGAGNVVHLGETWLAGGTS